MNVAQLLTNRQSRNKLLAELLELTKTEKAQLDSDEIEALVKTAKSWDSLAARTDVLEKSYQEALRLLRAESPERPFGEHTDAFEALKAEEIRLLEDIQRIQLQSTKAAEARREQFTKELKGVQKSNQRVNSYINPYHTLSDSIYFDKKK